MGILDLVSAILAREILWVPVLLLVFNQILKVAFSLLKLLSNTLREVAVTVGAELCAVGIVIHVAVMAKSDTAFGRYFPANKQAAAGALLLVIYFGLTCVSLMFL